MLRDPTARASLPRRCCLGSLSTGLTVFHVASPVCTTGQQHPHPSDPSGRRPCPGQRVGSAVSVVLRLCRMICFVVSTASSQRAGFIDVPPHRADQKLSPRGPNKPNMLTRACLGSDTPSFLSLASTSLVVSTPGCSILPVVVGAVFCGSLLLSV